MQVMYSPGEKLKSGSVALSIVPSPAVWALQSSSPGTSSNWFEKNKKSKGSMLEHNLAGDRMEHDVERCFLKITTGCTQQGNRLLKHWRC